MQLYHNPASPFVRKVMVTLIESGQRDDVTLIDAAGNPFSGAESPVAHNPLGKLPTLVRDDGPALMDSRVICRFLDDRAAGGLYPAAHVWETLTLEALADGIMEAAVQMVYEERYRPEAARYPAWVDAQWDRIQRVLHALEARWMSHLSGRLDIGQIALGCALGYLDLRHPDRDWRRGLGPLVEWEARFAERPAMQATRAA